MLAQPLKRSLFVLGLSALLALTGLRPSAAQPLSARSGPQTVALLELYTSEGCNSCPPADEWVRSLSARTGFTLDRMVPLGLHVDYWDDLGWPDRFAQAIFTRRQREIAARHRSRTVYTPQVVLQGQSLTQWNAITAEVQRINQMRARADLTLEVTPAPDSLEVIARGVVPEAAARSQARMYVALYENRLTSKVTAGENAGRTLQHDHVVRQWMGPLDFDEQGIARLQQTVRLDEDWKRPDLGLVAFVQQQQTGDVLQALALPLGQRNGQP